MQKGQAPATVDKEGLGYLIHQIHQMMVLILSQNLDHTTLSLLLYLQQLHCERLETGCVVLCVCVCVVCVCVFLCVCVCVLLVFKNKNKQKQTNKKI